MLLNEIVRACRGSFGYPADMEITQISSDTRTMQKGCVFIALEGELFDGHDFAVEAMEKGAEAVICQRPIQDVKCIIVDSTKQALLELATFYRRRFPALLVGVTGSVGKTTVTEMLAEIMSCKGDVLKTEENKHNEIGLPLTILKFNEDHKTAVVEMGITATNGISNLSVVAQPDIEIITNIGYAHYESYGSLESILKAKLEILDGASYNTPLILNLDDKLLAQVETRGARTIVYYSLKDKKADFYAEGIKFNDGKTSFKVRFDDQKVLITINCLGKHNVRNALAAFAGAVSAGASEFLTLCLPKQLIVIKTFWSS
ncbi:MAG: UDP-N-acetylmuramoyl-tripeptide--D-alanyl-D-alanine ligase, partial [Clostridiales bacterium]|nr:UDP-N-acetylmuramoyl-tripeptide--D-alanyl-D-alanine ligase [Clostridiales bacterium]